MYFQKNIIENADTIEGFYITPKANKPITRNKLFDEIEYIKK